MKQPEDARWREMEDGRRAYLYESSSARWSSDDGYNWIDEDGEPATGDEFDSLVLKLVGGPRDGDIVS